ncbi:proton-coupled amino acid transporter-like protein CG1139 [Coccinella septempunctata]|uniref:proton-coupled amino acid transporter-like protein CG1139 n=1 Tax=Coccinella septempunctata TaxID=41139 RepID=UPI001D08175B|nr:proton-coupled amino acid transporter-like protein CG1139 [Coccinella septempunctata]XP_044747695.1 proton-coupled amino acid transporter-like protein CG1139 [Coccinella septempunctata]XP_044747696.1 proton-coupled amino acid transporter-like protein CG1139 [Coccinella septempunctata]
MVEKKIDRFPSTFTIDNFSSTTTLTPNDIKIPIGRKETINEKQYDPYEHRTLEHPNTFSGALIHILKSSMGTGILAIPMAFKYAGLVTGFIGTMLVGLLCTHTIHILVVASQKMCIAEKRPSMGFSETAHAVFKYGPKPLRPLAIFARLFVDIGLILTYFFGNAVYVVFIGDSLSQIMSHYCPELKLGSKTFMLALMVFLLFACQIRPLKFLVPFSAIANISMMVCFGITFYYMIDRISDPEGEVGKAALSKGISGLPKFMVTVIFAMEGIGTILPVENSMVKSNFIGCPGVLNTAMVIIVFLFGSVGFFGYYVFGEDTKASVTYNLNDDDLAMVAIGCISLAVSLTFMLQFYVPMEISWRYVHPHIPTKYHNMVQIVWRLIAVIFITLIAIVVPDLGTIIDLVGALFLATLGLFVPAVLDLVVNWEDGLGFCRWKLYKNVLVMLISIFATVSGTYFAIGSLLE